MVKFKVGDTVVRTGITFLHAINGKSYIVKEYDERDDTIRLVGISGWYNAEGFELKGTQPEPAQQNDWSYAKADALYAAAEKAIAEYNEYIQRKPSTFYGSISMAGTRLEPKVEVHDGDA